MMKPLLKILHLLPPELAHDGTIKALQAGLVPAPQPFCDPILKTQLWGLDFLNPIGLAAGFDKNAEVPVAMLKLGFGFVETGTVTPLPQTGNVKPRIFRWPQGQAVINRLGFNNKGLDVYCANLKGALAQRIGIIGANVGRNKDSVDGIADYVKGVRAVSPLADYVVINISSPNTPGLRGLQNKSELEQLLHAVQQARAALEKRPPLLVKIAPDLDEMALEDIAGVALASNIDGLIISNTTITRAPDMPPELASQAGGLSGPPVFNLANQALRGMARLTKKRLPLIGVGGVSSAMDAYIKIKYGASLVQLYTGLIYQGPWLARAIAQGLAELLSRDGFNSVAEAVGVEV